MTRDPTGTDHRVTRCRARHAPPLGSQTINAVVIRRIISSPGSPQ
jgi:hypothetical protein